jgi:hypothetical protein
MGQDSAGIGDGLSTILTSGFCPPRMEKRRRTHTFLSWRDPEVKVSTIPERRSLFARITIPGKIIAVLEQRLHIGVIEVFFVFDIELPSLRIECGVESA